MIHESIVEKLFDEKNNDVIELGQADGNIVRFEQVAVIYYNEQYFAILHPIELKEDEVVIFRVIEDDEDILELVEDEELSKKILEVYAEDVGENN